MIRLYLDLLKEKVFLLTIKYQSTENSSLRKKLFLEKSLAYKIGARCRRMCTIHRDRSIHDLYGTIPFEKVYFKQVSIRA